MVKLYWISQSELTMITFKTLKENIIQHGVSSLEVEYEQLFIRANNNEPRNNSEYFIVDRQLTMPRRDRIDLSAVYWAITNTASETPPASTGCNCRWKYSSVKKLIAECFFRTISRAENTYRGPSCLVITSMS